MFKWFSVYKKSLTFFFLIYIYLRICLLVFSLTVVNFLSLLCIVKVLSCLKIEPLPTVTAAIFSGTEGNLHNLCK